MHSGVTAVFECCRRRSKASDRNFEHFDDIPTSSHGNMSLSCKQTGWMRSLPYIQLIIFCLARCSPVSVHMIGLNCLANSLVNPVV